MTPAVRSMRKTTAFHHDAELRFRIVLSFREKGQLLRYSLYSDSVVDFTCSSSIGCFWIWRRVKKSRHVMTLTKEYENKRTHSRKG